MKKYSIDKEKPFYFQTSPPPSSHTRIHTANIVKIAIQELECEIFLASAVLFESYSDRLPLFCLLSNYMQNIIFNNKEGHENWPNNFFEINRDNFWQNEIQSLLERWEQIANNGDE